MDEVKKEHEHSEHHHEPTHESIHEHVEHHKKSTTEKIRNNPWVLASIVLGILAVVLLISMFSSGNISASDAGTKLLSYYTAMGIANLSLSSVSEVSGIYQVNLDYKGQIVPLYITKDGKNIITSLNPTETNSSSTNTQSATVPKSDKPTVELYVFAYCPYGLQMEKAILPVVSLLGNKINFAIRQIGAMHGDFEQVEAQRQLCIEKNYPSKYLDYISAFAVDTSCTTGDAACVLTKTTSIYSKLGISAATVNSCMTTDGSTLYNAEVQNAQSVGVSGSPTLIINGVQASADRSPEAIKGVICNAFNTVPSACSQTLDTNQASAGFGSSSSSSSSSAASCG